MKHQRSARLQLGMMAMGVALSASFTFACMWTLYTDHSVRFNSFRKGRGFYRLPPLPIQYDSKTGKEISANDMDAHYGEDPALQATETSAPNPFQPSAEDLSEQIKTASQQQKLGIVQARLQQFLQATTIPPLDDEVEQQSLRNSAVDRLDALSAWRKGASAKAVIAYLAARDEYDAMAREFAHAGATENPPINEHWQKLDEALSNAPQDRHLQDNWGYLQAARLYQAKLSDSALQAFQQHVAQYPHSEKNEAALYMVAKLTMQFSSSFENTACGIDSSDVEAVNAEPKENCQDESWRAAVNTFRQLMKKYPNGRYFNDARGWLAYLYRRGGERAQALAEYYRMLGHPTDWRVRLEAKKSLQVIGHDYSDEVLDQVEALLANDPQAALAYAYHRIYNCAVDYTYKEANDWAYYSDVNERWRAKEESEKRVAGEHQAGQHELARVARFATAMMRRYPQARLSGSFVLRVAQAQLELQNYAEALALARKALAMGVSGEAQAQALWVKGSAEHQAKDFAAASVTFMKLIAAFPQANLTEGARRLLAMTAEDRGDYETAFEQYLALNYAYDVAFYADVLLTTERLARFVATHQRLAQANELTYALGLRYMRDNRWSEARETLQQVQTKATIQPVQVDASAPPPPRRSHKEPDWEDYDWREVPFIKTPWVMQDLQTIDALERLEKAVATAGGDEAKAEAMYQLASYQFDADALLFYNPMAWRGQRYWLLSGSDASDFMRLPNEPQLILNYSQQHDTLARAIPLYLEIVRRFPHTKAAPDALYSAAVAHQHLSNLNPYWRDIYGQGLFAGPQRVTYADVRRLYPRYQLPRGTNGWEAATRTVNGGPGWAPPPPKLKPAPKPTRTQRVKRWVRRIAAALQAEFQPHLNRLETRYSKLQSACLAAVAWALGLVGLWYAAVLGQHAWKLRLRDALPQVLAQAALWREQLGGQLSQLLENLRWRNATPKALGLFAAEVPPAQLPETESRVEKIIGYEDYLRSLPTEDFESDEEADETPDTNNADR